MDEDEWGKRGWEMRRREYGWSSLCVYKLLMDLVMLLSHICCRGVSSYGYHGMLEFFC